MKKYAYISEVEPVSFIPGHYRYTLAHNDQLMLCVFEMKKGTTVSLHRHEQTQIGLILDGKMEFFYENGVTFTAGAGGSYIFGSNEIHGCVALEDSKFVECFSPSRKDYE